MSNFTEDVVVSEVITFTANHEVNRAMPFILKERGTIDIATWNSFCNKLDDAQKPLREQSHKFLVMAFSAATIVLIILLCIGESIIFDSGGAPIYYYPVVVILLILCIVGVGKFKGVANKTVQSNLLRVCSDMSNQDNNLTVTLAGDEAVDKPEYWYINIVITGMNINTYDIQNSYVSPIPVPVAVASATATTAIPVAYATEADTPEELAVDPFFGTEAPKKYMKNKTGSGLTLNPLYKEWMTANGNPTQ